MPVISPNAFAPSAANDAAAPVAADLREKVRRLARLRGANVVAARRDGVHVLYRVIEPKVHHVLTCIRECDT